ncbi:nucleotide-binding alpha-beta plait [Anaeramoeba flamelloides]|uniref:Nucleotide-binding alpha-beta plait n=1 Tax=Anaeramoeba flamelloides TaxID=1746091 RepID=A0AAV7YH85_9EUKA|nr:nucleotide-binding alpha-beta plait [Anaeramoeba flamelloides]
MYQAPNQLQSNFNSQRYNSPRGRGGRGRGGFRGRGRGGITGRGRGGFRGRGRGYENYKTRRIINNNQSNFNNFNPNPNFVNTNNQNQNNFNNFNKQQQNFQKEKETPTLKEIEKKIQNAQSNTNNKLGDLESKDQEKAQKVFQYLKTFRVFCKNNNLNMAENLLSDIENFSVVLANNNLMPNNYKKNPKKKISQEFYTNPVLRRLRSKTSGKYDLKKFQNSNMAKLILNTIDIRTYLTGTLSTFIELKKKRNLSQHGRKRN